MFNLLNLVGEREKNMPIDLSLKVIDKKFNQSAGCDQKDSDTGR